MIPVKVSTFKRSNVAKDLAKVQEIFEICKFSGHLFSLRAVKDRNGYMLTKNKKLINPTMTYDAGTNPTYGLVSS